MVESRPKQGRSTVPKKISAMLVPVPARSHGVVYTADKNKFMNYFEKKIPNITPKLISIIPLGFLDH